MVVLRSPCTTVAIQHMNMHALMHACIALTRFAKATVYSIAIAIYTFWVHAYANFDC